MSRRSTLPVRVRLERLEDAVDRLEWRLTQGLREVNDLVNGLDAQLDRIDRRQRPYGDGGRDWPSGGRRRQR